MNPLLLTRSYSMSGNVARSARRIRREFLDYFCNDHRHTLIPSSPVAPLTDPTLAFVNSGMNQFKGVFLNYQGSRAERAANSQKCLRIGGKHNDLKVVGEDGYHHTFFEMLGSWSFGSYFKEDACRYAWNLLTQQYGIDKNCLYVTYFEGNEALGLKPDHECREIWRKIGVPSDKILPFGMQENFWEMGPMGPCGPSTEIHVDLTKTPGNRSNCVNKGYADLTELWNIVFIQYERLQNGDIINLDRQFVDTGMGFERLVALLQNKTSNYDTDLFVPLFDTIEKFYGAPKYQGAFGEADANGVDRAYRILADHSRAVTVALADGIIPEKNHKLRRLIRKAINTGRTSFNKEGILKELSYRVAENLSDAYPELQTNINKVQQVLQFEEDVYADLRQRFEKHFAAISARDPEVNKLSDWVIPGFINGYKKIKAYLTALEPGSVIPGEVSFYLYDTYGISPDAQADLAEVHGLRYDDSLLEKELESRRVISRLATLHWPQATALNIVKTLEEVRVPKTDDSPKYEYAFAENDYQFPDVNAKVLGFFINDRLVLNKNTSSTGSHDNTDIMNKSDVTADDINYLENNDVAIILERTPCYATEGGQGSDKGSISINNVVFDLYNVQKLDDYILHFVKYSKSSSAGPQELSKENQLDIADDCVVRIASEHRKGLMRNHTVIHLLNEAVEKVLHVYYPRTHFAGANSLEFTVASRETETTPEIVMEIEDIVNAAIKANIPVRTKVVDSLDLYKEENLRLDTSAIYPYSGIRIVEIESEGIRSKEPCCGTHVFNTGHLQHFTILKSLSKPTGIKFEATTGPLALDGLKAGDELLRETREFVADVKARQLDFEEFKVELIAFWEKLKSDRYKNYLPVRSLKQSYDVVDVVRNELRIRSKETEMSLVSAEIMSGLQKSHAFITHHFTRKLTYLSLHEVLEHHQSLPMFIIMSEGDLVKARCFVPQKLITEEFNARKWMKAVTRVLNSKPNHMSNIDYRVMCKMNSRRFKVEAIGPLVQEALAVANEFASSHLDPKESEAKAN